MAADDCARQACVNCKTRKKKCNKVLPSCGYCIQKQLGCRYTPASQAGIVGEGSLMHRETLVGEARINGLPVVEPLTKKADIYRPVFESLDEIYLEVQRIIRSTGEFVDDLTAYYFQHFHDHLPIISRTRFQNSLIVTSNPPSADVSALLLSVCLIAYGSSESKDRHQDDIGRQSLYLATKALLAQVQGSMQPSVSLIQSILLLAIYEYASGRPQVALVTIAGCARMAYAARIHIRRHTGNQVEVEEAGNTWWAIVMYERAFACEVDAFEQPMATTLPSGDARLPVERDILDRLDNLSSESIPRIDFSHLTSTKVGGFGRAAQASCILDQVIRGLSVPDVNSRLILLESLDNSIQSFLTFFLSHNTRAAVHCTAVAFAVRGLFVMHSHILGIPQQAVSANFKSLEEWKKASLAALNTATTLVIDIAECHCSFAGPGWADETSPNHIFMVAAAVKHMVDRYSAGNSPWPESVKDQLQLYLENIRTQWVSHS